MSIQLKNYRLSNVLIKEAMEIGHAAREKGKEFGAVVCTRSTSPPWQLYPGSRCEGETCGINVGKSQCKIEDSSDMGDIHAHPLGGAEFSALDLMGAAYGKKPITCVVGRWNMRCATRKEGLESEDVLKSRYPELIKRYHEVIKPFYDEWDKTGVWKPMAPEVLQAYKDIIAELEGYFDFHDFEFSDLVDAMDLEWSERQRKMVSQEV